MVGPMMDRSAAQQLTHWARIGRAIEASSNISQRAIADAVSSGTCYDTLSPEEQAVVRAEWGERIEARRAGLDLAARFTRDGRSYVEADEQGAVVVRTSKSPGRRRSG